MTNFLEEINFELLEETNEILVVESMEDGGFIVELNGDVTNLIEMNDITLLEAIKDNDIKVYAENWETKADLKNMTSSFQEVSLALEADGTNENDIYLHRVIEEDNEFKVDENGKFYKTYKSEKKAIEKAWELGSVKFI